MREHISRGYNNEVGWVEGYLDEHTMVSSTDTYIATVINKKPEHVYDDESWIVDPDTVGEWTGLYDATSWVELFPFEQKKTSEREWCGKKIFEDDICTSGINTVRIVWRNYQWMCQVIDTPVDMIRGCYFPLWQYSEYPPHHPQALKVIGNAHFHPERLKGVTG